MKYKVGDKVKIRSWDNLMETYSKNEEFFTNCIMNLYTIQPICGKECTITKLISNPNMYELDHGFYIDDKAIPYILPLSVLVNYDKDVRAINYLEYKIEKETVENKPVLSNLELWGGNDK